MSFATLPRPAVSPSDSRLLRATSGDGIHFVRDAEPALAPEADYERQGGVEDPRLVKIGATWYLTYTAYDGRRCRASSTSP